MKLIKNVGHVFCQIFNRDVFGWLLAKFNNPFPASQVRFQPEPCERLLPVGARVTNFLFRHSGTP